MELETINKLYLELSQIATARTSGEEELLRALRKANEMLRSAYQIASRKGKETNWESFTKCLEGELVAEHDTLREFGSKSIRMTTDAIKNFSTNPKDKYQI